MKKISDMIFFFPGKENEEKKQYFFIKFCSSFFPGRKKNDVKENIEYFFFHGHFAILRLHLDQVAKLV